MGGPAGFNGQFMIGEETVWGTGVPPTRSLEIVNETIKKKVTRIESKGIRAGKRVLTTGKWVAGAVSCGGDVLMEVPTVSAGLIFKHMMGGAAISGSSGVFTQTYTPGDLPVGLTAQVGRPDLSGAVRPFTYTGGRIPSWEMSCKAGELLMLKLAMSFQDETTATALATFAEAANYDLLSFAGGTITAGGVQVDVADVSLKGDNKLDTGRSRLRGAATIKQQIENDFRDYSGSLTADFESLVQYNHFLAADEFSLVMAFVGPLIPSQATPFSLTVTMNVRYDSDTPNLTGAQDLKQPLTFKCINSSGADSSAISMAYVTSDAAA